MKPQKSKIKISVIIPAYNEENYISACLDSLMAQTNAPVYEVIVADNGSQDKTVQIAKKYANVRIVHARHRGVAHARQAGLDAALGEIIVSTDADCTFRNDWLAKIWKEYAKNTTLAGVAGHYYFYNGPLWTKVFPTMGAVLVWMIYKVFGVTIYASAANLSFRRTAFNTYDCSQPQGSDERGVVEQIKHHGKVKVILHNPVHTSARRLRKGFFYAIFVTLGYYYSYNVWKTKKEGKSTIGHQPLIRDENHKGTKAMALEWALFIVATGITVYYVAKVLL